MKSSHNQDCALVLKQGSDSYVYATYEDDHEEEYSEGGEVRQLRGGRGGGGGRGSSSSSGNKEPCNWPFKECIADVIILSSVFGCLVVMLIFHLF